MNQTNPFGGTPVRDLQTMLRTLAQVHREIPFFTPNGIFGEETLEGVMVLQRLLGLPVTGTVDQATGAAITAEYDRVRQQLAHPRTANLFPRYTAPIHPGQSSPMLFPIQGMFLALAPVFEAVHSIAPSGVLDSETAANLHWIQQCGNLQETGILDRATWEALARVYETFVARAPLG